MLALSRSAYCCSCICLSWHPWTWSQTTFSWQATWGPAVSRQEAGHSGLKTDLHSVRNRAPLCSGGHLLPGWPGGPQTASATQMPPLKAARRCGYSGDKSALSIHGYQPVHPTPTTVRYPPRNHSGPVDPPGSSQDTGRSKASQGPEEPGYGGRKAGRQARKYLLLLRGLGQPLSLSGPQLLLCKGARKSQPRRESKCQREKQSRALGGLPMATGPLWSEEPLSQERLAGAQSPKGGRPLCLPPANTN